MAALVARYTQPSTQPWVRRSTQARHPLRDRLASVS